MATIRNPGEGPRARLRTGTQAPICSGVNGRLAKHRPFHDLRERPKARTTQRATQIALGALKSTECAWIAPAGGRAVAGSIPVSPDHETPATCDSRFAGALVWGQLSAQFWTPNSPPSCGLALRGGSRPTTAGFRAGWSQVGYDPSEAHQGPEASASGCRTSSEAGTAHLPSASASRNWLHATVCRCRFLYRERAPVSSRSAARACGNQPTRSSIGRCPAPRTTRSSSPGAARTSASAICRLSASSSSPT